MFRGLVIAWRRHRNRKVYVHGRRLRRFLAPDIRREVEVVDDSEVDIGFVTVRVRTSNLLYVRRGLAPEPEFTGPQRLEIEPLWTWDGASWGGAVPDDDPGRSGTNI